MILPRAYRLPFVMATQVCNPPLPQQILTQWLR
jgi:hypothetical protein